MIRLNKTRVQDPKHTKNNPEFPHAGVNKKEDSMKHFTFRVLALMLAFLMIFASCSRSSSASTCRVVFNLNGGELVSGSLRQTVKSGASAEAPEAVNGNKTLSWDKQFSKVTKDIVVNAVWTDTVYTVTFNPNGGNLVSGEVTQTVPAGGNASAPTLENGKKTLSWDGDFTNINADTVVTAVWSDPTHSVIFNLNGGTLVGGETNQTVVEGTGAVAPTVTNGTKNLSWDRDFSNITADTIVNAIWTDKTYTVTFNPGVSGLSSKTVTVTDGAAAAAPVFERDGWDFKGWDHDISHVTGDMTVRAIWERHQMTSVEIGEFADSRVVTVNTDQGTGTGFFIDDQGTLITNYHVIEYASNIFVTMSDGAIYPISRVINFAEKYDIAVLRAEITGNRYFETTADITKGENVFAVGSSLGFLQDTLTSGIVSATTREIGLIDCIQTNADITHGNSGGPLLNQYGEVIGVNSYGYSVNGASGLNLAIKIRMLDQLGPAMNYTVADYVEWWQMQQEQSYYFTSLDDTDVFSYSIVNTYQSVTGARCIASADSFNLTDETTLVEDYYRWLWVFVYNYNESNYNRYINYLKEIGFVYDSELSEKSASGTLNVYYSPSMDKYILIRVTNELSDWGAAYVLVSPRD